MTQRGMSVTGRLVVQVAILSGCMIGALTGCSSQLRTTIVSGSEAQKPQVTQLEPETVVVEEVVAQPIHRETVMDIPVEAPPTPSSRSNLPAEIFATPKSTDAPLKISPFSEETPSAPAANHGSPSTPRAPVGIPPTTVEPEMPVLPQSSYAEGPSNSQDIPIASEIQPDFPVAVPPTSNDAEIPLTPEHPATQEPVQIAKVMPQEAAETIVETLEAALSDIYFDYDQFAIRNDAETLLKVNAQLLSGKLAEKHIVIEGHCDERGTQSYNMVLGERRAKAVKDFLQDLGVSGDNLQVVSYGKDKPFCTEQSEACWQENRRGHFVIK